MSAIQGRPDGVAAAGGGGRRCVLLAPDRPEALATTLLGALNRRGLTVVVVTDPPRAMLELARYGAMALIVADPDRVQGAAELIEAVRTHCPRIVCWQYCDRQLGPINGRLGGVRLSAGVTDPGSEPDSASPANPADPLVSKEELAMLLDDAPDGIED